MGKSNSKPKDGGKKKPVNNNNVSDNGEPIENKIIEKLKQNNKQAATLPESELKEWARSLCFADDLKECYLNPEFATTIATFSKLDDTQQKTNSKGTAPPAGVFVSVASQGSAPERPEAMDDVDFDMEEIMQEQQQPYYNIAKKQIKVKLVIAEICKGELQKTIRKMLSPILTKFDQQQQFGMFHSAVVVGPWYIEWNNSSLCIPRKCYSGAAMIAADLQLNGLVKKIDMDEAINKISHVIIDWNLNKTYNQTQNNCQNFVDEICKSLGFDLSQFTGPLAEYMNALRGKGQCEIDFPISPDMREKFGIKEAKRHFETHEDIDKFVRLLVEKEPQFEEKYKQEWGLLKSFDRAFWLRHYKNADDPRYKPLDEECPFSDPQSTMSFKKDWF